MASLYLHRRTLAGPAAPIAPPIPLLYNEGFTESFATDAALGWVRTSGSSRWGMPGNGHAICAGTETYIENDFRFEQTVNALGAEDYRLTLRGEMYKDLSDPGWRSAGWKVIISSPSGGIIYNQFILPAFSGEIFVEFTAQASDRIRILIGETGWRGDLTHAGLIKL